MWKKRHEVSEKVMRRLSDSFRFRVSGFRCMMQGKKMGSMSAAYVDEATQKWCCSA
jgi:hypothetical protein